MEVSCVNGTLISRETPLYIREY